MPQQINLLDASLQRRREPLGSLVGLAALAATLAASGVLACGLQSARAHAEAEAAATETTLAGLQARVAMLGGPPASSSDAVELARLREVEAGQRRVRAALASGEAGKTQGYAEYLMALSRQTQGRLWLTGFSVSPDGRALELGGRMTDPRQLPDYLRHLNAEPLFKGREFAQLNLSQVDPAAGSPNAGSVAGNGAVPAYTEFVLRTAAAASEPR